MSTAIRRLQGTFGPDQVEQLFNQWRQDNADAHRYSLVFTTDGRAACQFDRLKFNWFEVNPADLINAWEKEVGK